MFRYIFIAEPFLKILIGLNWSEWYFLLIFIMFIVCPLFLPWHHFKFGITPPLRIGHVNIVFSYFSCGRTCWYWVMLLPLILTRYHCLPARISWWVSHICRNTLLITEYKVEEIEGPSFKETLLDYAKKCCGFLCVFDCCFLWIKTAEKLSFFIFDPFTELFITICNVGSVILMTLDHYSVQYDGM